MNYETKALLKRSINEFRGATMEQKDTMVSYVENELKRHERGLKSIGMGLAENHVRAGKIFLRIFK